jgi:AcrR family transcriptional regulator
MVSKQLLSRRRAEPLSRERVVETAIDILDAGGNAALTLRALADRLSTGPGAIYHHLANKRAVARAATASVIDAALSDGPLPADAAESVRELALRVFDAIDAHPWVGAQLALEPWQPAVVRLFEAIGTRLPDLGVPENEHFDSASALVNYVLGLAGQYAAGARLGRDESDRALVLRDIAEEWAHLDEAAFPFMRRMALHLSQHDDRAQFGAGIDLILDGIRARHPIERHRAAPDEP